MDDQFQSPPPGAMVRVKENPATWLLADADRARSAARRARRISRPKAEAAWSRMAVFLYCAALEGFINFVYWYSEVDDIEWERWPTHLKWMRAPEQCLSRHGQITTEDGMVIYRPGDPIDAFDDGTGLLGRFRELRDVRNAMVHPQPVFTSVVLEAIDDHLTRGGELPLTGLPARLVNFRLEHAETASEIFDAMVARLDSCLKGQVADLVRSQALYEWRVSDEPGDEFDDGAGQLGMQPTATRVMMGAAAADAQR